jgi:DNA-binding LytR/AlgR family response regulator
MLYLSQITELAAEIMYLEGERNYTYIYWTNGERVLFSKSISVIMERLPENSFLRISKQHCVNRAYVVSYSRRAGKRVARLSTNLLLQVSRRRVSNIKQVLAA